MTIGDAGQSRSRQTGSRFGDADLDAAVAAFIRTKGVTRCPTACVGTTQATIGSADREALRRRWAEGEARRLVRNSGLMVNPPAAAGPRAAGDPGAKGRASLKAAADRFAASVMPIIDSIQTGGTTGLNAIADELNRRGIGAPRGGKWRGSAVRRLLARTTTR